MSTKSKRSSSCTGLHRCTINAHLQFILTSFIQLFLLIKNFSRLSLMMLLLPLSSFSYANMTLLSDSWSSSPNQDSVNINLSASFQSANELDISDVYVNINVSGGGTPSIVTAPNSCSSPIIGSIFSCGSLSAGQSTQHGFALELPEPGVYTVTYVYTCSYTQSTSPCSGFTASHVLDVSNTGTVQIDSSSFTVDEGHGTVTIPVSRSGGTDFPATATISTSNGTAISGSDFSSQSQTVSWAYGESGTKNVSISIIDDSITETDENFTVSLANVTNASLGTLSTAAVTITDNDTSTGVISFVSDSLTVHEEDGTATVTLQRTGGSSGAASVEYATHGGTADEGVDYTAATGSVSWIDGEEGTKTITINLTDDTLTESSETFSVLLSGAVGATLSTQGSATVTILDNDNAAGEISLSSTSLSVDEGVGSATISVVRSGGSSGAASVSFQTQDGSAAAGSDFSSASGSLSWLDGEEGAKTITVPIIDDSIEESSESFTVVLSNGSGATLSQQNSATVTIADNDAEVVQEPGGNINLASNSLSVNEGDSSVSILVTRSDGSAGTSSVVVRSADNTAQSGSDYLSFSETLTWADGESGTKSITVGIIDDSIAESDETFTVSLSNPSGASSLGSLRSSTITINDNDSGAGEISISNSELTVSEDGSSATITLLRSGGLQGAASVLFQTNAGTASEATDFVAQSGSVIWGDGEDGAKTIVVDIVDDAVSEQSESFTVQLSGVSGAELSGQSIATITISDNDTAVGSVEFSTDSISVNEDAGTVTVSVNRTSGSFGAASVSVGSVNGTAEAGSDYEAVNNTVSWADGEEGTKTVTLTIIDDNQLESAESFNIQLSDVAGANLGNTSTLSVTIGDNDGGVVQFDNSSLTVSEGSGSAEVSVTRTGSTGAAEVDVIVSGGTAESDTDYQYTAATLSWADGESGSKSVQFSIVDDTLNEGNETITLSLSNPSSGVVLSGSVVANITIADNDTESPVDSTIENALVDLAQGDPQQEDVAKVIADVCPRQIASPQLQADCNALVGAALSDDPAQRSAAAEVLKQITVDDATAASDVSERGARVQKTNLARRLRALRSGQTGIDLTGLSFNLQGLHLSKSSLPVSMRENGGAAGDEDRSVFADNRLGVFVGGSVDLGDKDATENEDGFEFTTQGLTLGVDYRLTDRMILGAALGYNSTDTDIDNNGGSLDSNALSLSLYGTTYQTDQFFVEGIVTFTRNDFDQKRNINYSLVGADSVSQIASADFDGKQLSVAVGGGYHFQYNEWTLTPSGRLEYIDTSVDGYSESTSNPNQDGGGWGIALNEQNLDSMTLTLGLDASYAMSQSWGILVPQASFEWVREFEDESRLISGNFVGDPSQKKFVLPTDAVDSSYFNLRVGVSGQFENGGSAYLFYQRLIGYDNLDVDSIGVGVRWTF